MRNKCQKKRDSITESLFCNCVSHSVIVLIETVVENEYNIPMNDSFGEEVQQMCNLSEGIEQRGIEKGIQQGIQQGILTGYQSLHHLMQAKAITLDQALDAVKNKDDFKKWLSLQK